MHLDATEHRNELIFLHAVKPGPANQSYGLQVAALAGVPRDVIRRARRYLANLEAQATEDHPQGALPLYPVQEPEDEPLSVEDPLGPALDEMDPDDMTPKQALEALYALKKLRD